MDQGYTIRRVADTLGIRRTTIEGWARRHAWRELRKERWREFHCQMNEERDFIVNYYIEYRMGQGNGDESESDDREE